MYYIKKKLTLFFSLIYFFPFLFQMSILLLFEKSDSLSYNELKATTKISDDHFPKHVQSLVEAKLLTYNTPVSTNNFKHKMF